MAHHTLKSGYRDLASRLNRFPQGAPTTELLFEILKVLVSESENLFVRGETQLGRVFVNETALPKGDALRVLDYERTSEVVRTSSVIGVGVCYCRHKMAHLDRACSEPSSRCRTSSRF